VDEILTMDRSGTYYYHQNGLWSVEAVTDSTGTVAERYDYDAYGAVTTTAGTNSWGTAHSAIGNPWMFTGREFDEETGLYYYRARTYDTFQGRFLERDPIGPMNGPNLYEYVSDRPTFWLDPYGECATCSGRNCRWTGHIRGSFGGVIFQWGGSLRVDATGVDDSGCTYAVGGSGRPKPGNLGLSGAALGVGYFSTAVDFEDFPARCMWPVNNGDEGQVGIIAVVSSGLAPRISNILSWAHNRAGELEGRSPWTGGGGRGTFNLIAGGGAAILEMYDVRHVGPSPPGQ
jgi:RHS repeat-associated protein